MRRLAAAAALFLGLIGSGSPALGGGPQPLHFLWQPPLWQQPVEQWTPWVNQPDCSNQCPFPDDHSRWVTNPTGCAWDVDDGWTTLAIDEYLSAGASTSMSACQVTEQNEIYGDHYGLSGWWGYGGRPFGVYLQAPSAGLSVTTCYHPQGRCFTASPVWDAGSKRYLYRSCVAVEYVPGDAALQPIAGSNGGAGVVTTETLTVMNPTGRKVQSITGQVSLVGVGATYAGCTAGNYQAFDYPFRWVP